MTLGAILAAVSIVFPPEGAKLPALSRCYVMGAEDAGEEVLEVRRLASGDDAGVTNRVTVWRTGAWATVVDVVPGENVVEVGGVKRSFFVGSVGALGSVGSVGSLGSVGSKGAVGSVGAKGALGSVGPKVEKTYKKLEYAGDVAKAHPTGKKPGEITVVVDAGHGGHDSGALSPHGLPEKDANLRLAKAVRDELGERGYKVVLTREDDTFVGLFDRPKVAHKADADLFVSIHHNAPGYSSNPTAIRSQSVYAWNPLGERLAKAINARMAAADPLLKNDGVLHANFAVTRNPEIPSCLIETDFITHPDGESAAWDASRRSAVAAAIADGIADWVAVKPSL